MMPSLIIELSDCCDECFWVAELFHNFSSEFVPNNSIESIGQVNKGCVEMLMLFHALFLKLAGGKYNASEYLYLSGSRIGSLGDALVTDVPASGWGEEEKLQNLTSYG